MQRNHSFGTARVYDSQCLDGIELLQSAAPVQQIKSAKRNGYHV